MTKLNDFISIVRLLKDAEYKPGSNGTIRGCLFASDEACKLIEDGNHVEFEFEFIEYSSVQNGLNKFKEALEDPSSCFDVEITHKKASDQSVIVYADLESFFKRYNPIGKGLPEEFYVLKENCHYPIDNLDELDKVKSILEFIDCLSSLAMYRDSDSNKEAPSLVFIGYDKDKHAEPVAIEAYISLDDVKELSGNLDFSLIKNLCNSASKQSDIHFDAKLSIFNSTISEVLGKEKDRKRAFKYLISNWEEFTGKYQKNIGIYTSGYVFGKIKHELAEKIIEVSESFSKVISDISTKILSIPISLMVIFFLRNLSDVSDYVLAIFALIFLSVFVYISILNQEKNLNRIIQAKNIYFEKVDINNSEVASLIESTREDLEKNEKFVERLICGLKYAAWLPLIAGFLYLVFKFKLFNIEFSGYINRIINNLC